MFHTYPVNINNDHMEVTNPN